MTIVCAGCYPPGYRYVECGPYQIKKCFLKRASHKMPWNCSTIVYCDTLWVFGLILVKIYPSPSIWQHEFVAAVVVVALTLTNGLTGTLNCFHLKINNLKHPSILAFNMLMPRVWGSVNHIKCTQSLVLYSRMSDWSEIQQLNSIILITHTDIIDHSIDQFTRNTNHFDTS